MYTILIAEPDLYSVGVFMTQEHAEKYKTDNDLPEDALVIEIKEEYHAKLDENKQPTNQPARTG